MLNSETYRRLLQLGDTRLIVWIEGGDVCVAYENCEVKDGIFSKSVFGRGCYFSAACEDYARKISGKKLIFNAESKNRKEVTVLL